MKHPFVESSENQLGIGKFVERVGNRATIEYFHSPAAKDAIRQEVAFASLSQKILCPQTRVYWRDSSKFTWAVGRILDYQRDDERYWIRFPNEERRMIGSDELFVRCRIPVSEPTDHLATQLNETAFWHSARSEFVHHLVDQHKHDGGLSALVSSSVEIVAHQASVIHRILLDPFQRYLLADEVGLGKTIEAGILIKQFALDEPENHKTLLIVPETLCIQWRQELVHRFHLGELIDKSIHVVGNKDQKLISQLVAGVRMIVIDEAHHLSSWAWSSVPIEQSIFSIVQDACDNVNLRVLLLSATPVSHNERSFLAMLHLLDPQVYPLDSLESFKDRVRLRQEIAECMLSLSEDESNFFVQGALEELSMMLPNDKEFLSLQSKLMALIENDVDEKDVVRVSLIRSIRTHISDIWRLHRRILRNRRTEKTSAYLPGRSRAIRLHYESNSEQGLIEAIESWRLHLSASFFTASEQVKHAAGMLARRMDEHAVTEPLRALDFAKNRMNGADSETSSVIPVTEEERELLKHIVRAAKDCDHNGKLLKLLELICETENQVSYVVFAHETETADKIFEFLECRLPRGRTLRHTTSNLAWSQYKSERSGYILVCDQAAEEGLNLQKRGAKAVHFDLPFSPNRIEQRMGRLDRFGAGTPVQSVALVCKGSKVHNEWFELLDEGFGVFRRSIASLQYVIDDAMTELWKEYLDLGADSFTESSARLKGEEGIVAKEFKKIRAQDEIDAFDADQFTQEVTDAIVKNDLKLSIDSPAIFDGWAITNLHFRSRGEENQRDSVFTYEFTRQVDTVSKPYGQDTLLPADEFLSRFRFSIDSLPVRKPTVYTTVPFTFDRRTSQSRSTRLLRVGDPFVDAFEKLTRWDDRGICFAFWRVIPGYESINSADVFFRFDYVVTPNPIPLVELCNKSRGANVNSLLRRSQAIMAPFFTKLWLDSNLERVMPDDTKYKLIETKFRSRVTSTSRDFNLNRDRWSAAASIYDMSLWEDLCYSARRKSEEILREQSRLPEVTEKCIAKAKELAVRVEQQYRSRFVMATGAIRDVLEQDLEFERDFLSAQVESFQIPELRVDSVGAVFLSSQMPFVDPPMEDEF